MKVLRALAAVAAAIAFAQHANAQDWPNRPITMVAPFATGGSTDAIARIVAEGLSAQLHQPVIVENVGGAGGMTGVFMAATAAALSFRTIGSGVPFGRNKAYQLGMSKPTRPCSCADGRPGKLAERFLLRIASVLMVLLAYCGITVGALGH